MATRISAERNTQLERHQAAQRDNIGNMKKENAALSEQNDALKTTVNELEVLIGELRSQLRKKDYKEDEANAELRRLRYFRWQQESLVAFISEEKQKAGAKTQTQRPPREECDRVQAEPGVVEKLDAHARLRIVTVRQNVFVNRVFGIQRTLELMDVEERTLQRYSNKSPVKDLKQRLREIKNHRRILQKELEDAEAEVKGMEKQRRNFQILAGKEEPVEDDLKLEDILVMQIQTLLDHRRIQQTRHVKVCMNRFDVCFLMVDKSTIKGAQSDGVVVK